LKALLVQHEDQVPPGRLLEVLNHLKWDAEVIMMEKSPEVPASINEFDCLVLLGGTVNVDDVKGYPYLENLRRLTSSAIKAGFPVLGLCLGAQMISRAVGGRVYRNQCGEIGWEKVWFTEEGLRDPVLQGFESPLEVFQWHDDMFDVPNGSALLGRSRLCPNQIIRLGKTTYGFQSHLEVTEDIIFDWIESYHVKEESRLGSGGADRLARDTREKMSLYNNISRQILLNYFNNILKLQG